MSWLFSASRGWTALPLEWNNCLQHLDMSKAKPFLRPEFVAKWVFECFRNLLSFHFLLLSGTGVCVTTSRSTWSGLCNFSPHNALGMQLCRLVRAVLQSIQFDKRFFDSCRLSSCLINLIRIRILNRNVWLSWCTVCRLLDSWSCILDRRWVKGRFARIAVAWLATWHARTAV